jgi:DNA-binding transcriptional MerR regulator
MKGVTQATKFLTTNEAAELTRFAPYTLRKWRLIKKGPKFYRVHGRIRYTAADLEKFMTASSS